MGKTGTRNARERIIEAASALFVEKGMDGVVMRELADRAGVNKGLLHYYFRTKKALYREVVVAQVAVFYREVSALLHGQGSLHDKVVQLVDRYFVLLEGSPALPAFILAELQRDPAIVLRVGVRTILADVIAVVEPELKRRGLPKERSSAMHFILDIIALCVLTFGMLPGVSRALNFTKAQRAAYLQERKIHIVAIIQHGLAP